MPLLWPIVELARADCSNSADEKHSATKSHLFRSYRTGELPDIEILHRELLQPVQALHRDAAMAKQLFVLIVRALYQQIGKWTSRIRPTSQDEYRQRLSAALYRHANSAQRTCPPPPSPPPPPPSTLCRSQWSSVHDSTHRRWP